MDQQVRYKHALTTSTGSFFMLFGHVSSGRFSGSPGLNRILSRFFTSSMRSLAALESSKRSFRMIRAGGEWMPFLEPLDELELPSREDLDEGLGDDDTE